jgi:hypothetical protein
LSIIGNIPKRIVTIKLRRSNKRFFTGVAVTDHDLIIIIIVVPIRPNKEEEAPTESCAGKNIFVGKFNDSLQFK